MKIKLPSRDQVRSAVRTALKVLGTFEGATSATKFGQFVGFAMALLGVVLSHLEHKEEPKSPEVAPPGSVPGSASVVPPQ